MVRNTDSGAGRPYARPAPADAPPEAHRGAALQYQSGFANEHETEAVAGALPQGGNSPQTPAFGLYAEQINATSFTVRRADNQRSWVYRIYPTAAAQSAWTRAPHERLEESAVAPAPSPTRYRWLPWEPPGAATDFIDGLTRVAFSGGARSARGMSLFAYAANRSMQGRVFSDVDGELLIVPQRGPLRVTTEMGLLDVTPGEVVLLPRGMRFSVELEAADCRGFVCENLGEPFRLPERGVIGANCLANERDFLAPVAHFEESASSVESICKYGGLIWSSRLKRSPFDVVAWRGNYAPYKYELRRFNALHSVTYDHPDPSIFCALTSPSAVAGVANADFCVLPPRWIVAENTFRPPYFHRNIMSEFVISIAGAPESRGVGYRAGSSHLHNAMSPHGPDPGVASGASQARLEPKWEDTLMVMFESQLSFSVTPEALRSANRDVDYEKNWDDTPVLFRSPSAA